MEENINTEVVEQSLEVTVDNPVTEDSTVVEEPATETTFTQADLDKRIQSETDKIRTKYTKQVKALEDKLNALSPQELSPIELEMKARLDELESRAAELDAKEAAIALQNSLTEAGLPADMANFVKGDIDVAAFVKVIEGVHNNRLKSKGYQPVSHLANDGVTKEQWSKMTYGERASLYQQNPEVYKKFM